MTVVYSYRTIFHIGIGFVYLFGMVYLPIDRYSNSIPIDISIFSSDTIAVVFTID